MTVAGPTLTATYRLQINEAFPLAAARAVVPYLERLGISHLYASPILKARKGSKHGYDVADPTAVNPELGTEDDLRALAGELHDRGMGLVLDIVPNHMGIGRDNPYWEDVLALGERSRYARWFDIDWDSPSTLGRRRVILPVLGDELEHVVARDEIRLEVGQSGPRLHYFDNDFPIWAESIPAEVHLARADPAASGSALAPFRGSAGRRRVLALLDAQHYRLVFSRRGPTEINYRRFFDVNDLVALDMSDARVFTETHALILRWVAEGVVDGLRVDHVDGLLDPLGYLTRLREEVTRCRRPADGGPFPIFVEKILSVGERLRPDWPVQGTTGYDFLVDLDDIFLNPQGYAELERRYRRLRRITEKTFADAAHAGKMRILSGPLRADVDRLARALERVAAVSERGIVRTRLVDGIVQFIAALPVYRTYIDGRAGGPGPEDMAIIDRAVADARARRSPDVDVVELVADVLRGNVGRTIAEDPDRLRFVQRLQQTSGAAAAKGVEDTAHYQYVPLASRNEVGGAPDRPLDDALRRLHEANRDRVAHWPSALVSTDTHDTKRSADVRSRLDVLSELPNEWERHFMRWRRLNSRYRSVVKGRLAPDINTESLLYQTLLSIWPAPRRGLGVDDITAPDGEWRATVRERLQRYMLKAIREAKTRTSWTDPDADFEQAVDRFVADVLEPTDSAPFLSDVARFVALIAPAGYWNALSRVLVHLTSPGVADLYQGDELWKFVLVDPDNRRSVDYDERATLLADVDRGFELDSMGADPADPRLKLLVTARLLRARRANPGLFVGGSYLPVKVAGEPPARVFAFSRSSGDDHAIVLAPRLHARFLEGRRTEPAEWGTASVAIPQHLRERSCTSVVDARTLRPGELTRDAVPLSTIFAKLPLALLLWDN